MEIESGASGGPVFRGNHIIGINSTSMPPFEEHSEYASFFTPIDIIQNLKVIENGKEVTVKSLIEEGYIKTKNNYA